MKRTKQERGITLIALIITIVVLLILAVVAVNSIQNEGILAHAENTAGTYNNAVLNEQGTLNEYEEFLKPCNIIGHKWEITRAAVDCAGGKRGVDGEKKCTECGATGIDPYKHNFVTYEEDGNSWTECDGGCDYDGCNDDEHYVEVGNIKPTGTGYHGPYGECLRCGSVVTMKAEKCTLENNKCKVCGFECLHSVGNPTNESYVLSSDGTQHRFYYEGRCDKCDEEVKAYSGEWENHYEYGSEGDVVFCICGAEI